MSSEFIYDTTKDIAYYKRRYFRMIIGHFLVATFIAIVCFLLAFGMHSHFLSAHMDQRIDEYLKYIWLIGGFSSISIGVWGSLGLYKEFKHGLYGVRVGPDGIKISGKFWNLKDVEFVLVDEGIHPIWGFVLIKTRKTPEIKITDKLLKNPQNFWKAVHWKERTFNRWDVEEIKNTVKFVESLRHYGVKVYWRKKWSDVIEEVK